MREQLLLAGSESASQTRFAAIGGVTMNDAALGRLIDGRNQTRKLGAIDAFGRTGTFVQVAQI